MAETLPIGTLEATAEPAKRKVPNNILGKDDFMSLMLTQIRHQDPLEP
ncbi:flagellar hook assembly protein FlgD, partial [bacterium]|nr:flagellar hook assembly protein FlgD [bacterium]